MNKQQLIRKLTSRKFWIALAGFVTGIILYATGDEANANKVGELILAAASVIAYAIGEGLADSTGAQDTGTTTAPAPAQDDDDLK